MRTPVRGIDSESLPPKLRITVARHTLADQVYASLKKAIIDGDLQPGERLKEPETALSLGASRTPVREAFSRLQQEGLVRQLKSGGLTVVELSEDDVREIFGLITVLETYAARLATARITDEELEHLRALCDQAEPLAESDVERLSKLNIAFHEALIAAAGQPRLQELIQKLRSAMQPYRAISLAGPQFRARSVRDHRQMLECLIRRDADGLANLVGDHLEMAQNVTIAALRDQTWRLKPGE